MTAVREKLWNLQIFQQDRQEVEEALQTPGFAAEYIKAKCNAR